MERDRFEIDASPYEVSVLAGNMRQTPEKFVVVHDHHDGHQSCAAFVRSTNDGPCPACEARIALFAAASKMAEALAPFADHAKDRGADRPEWRDGDKVQIVVSIGYLRAVLAALAAATGGEK